jgi:hypothetical protein
MSNEIICPKCRKGCVACFEAGKSYVEPVQEELDRLLRLIDDVKALHQELKVSEDVSYCVMCAERWPCASIRILNHSEVELVSADHA